jgi:ankyrin repeat protein
MSGLINVLEYILQNQCIDVDVRDGGERTLLFYAAYNNHSETVEWLLDCGANPNAQDVTGQTPLHIAACEASVGIVENLIRKRSKTRFQSSPRHTRSICDNWKADRGEIGDQ